MLRLALVPVVFVAAFSISVSSACADIQTVIGYLEKQVPAPPVLYNLEEIPEDEGLAGARIAIKDNATTGRFLKQGYTLEEVVIPEDGDTLAGARELLAKAKLLVVKAPAADLLAIADMAEAQGALIFNAGAPDVALRDANCRANIFHTLASRDMLADALAQFSVSKRWSRWALVHGVHDGDLALKAALENSARKFGLTIAGQKEWAFDADMRRNAGQEVPLFTQDFDEHDLLIVADEIGDFGRYLLYNTWAPRPVAGSEGLTASTWSASVEANGAVQLQNRFRKASGRGMNAIDYAAWAGVRAIGEAVTRTNSSDPVTLRAFLLSAEFELAGFKGAPLTFRDWNGQLRQPIPLSHPRALAAMAPLDGFLHERTPLDSLGLDKPESKCTLFGG